MASLQGSIELSGLPVTIYLEKHGSHQTIRHADMDGACVIEELYCNCQKKNL